MLNAIYETDFLGFSYGFRPGRSQHQAPDALYTGLLTRKVNWVLDLDIQAFFDGLSHEWLVKFVEHRIADRRVVRMDITKHFEQRCVSAAKCQSCKNFVLVVGIRQASTNQPFVLANVYPYGKPKDDFDPAVPPLIGADFGEALRCHWIKAYKGCVVMCRRSVQSSALKFEAPKNQKLDKQIDWLFEKGKITEALKDFAHEVRLTGNVGAHPDKDSGQQPDDADADDLENVTQQDATDIIEFTREYLHHVYVMPAKLKARKAPTLVAGTNNA